MASETVDCTEIIDEDGEEAVAEAEAEVAVEADGRSFATPLLVGMAFLARFLSAAANEEVVLSADAMRTVGEHFPPRNFSPWFLTTPYSDVF